MHTVILSKWVILSKCSIKEIQYHSSLPLLLTLSFLLLSQAIIEDIRDHRELVLDSLESAVSNVLMIESEEDQKELSHQLGEVTWHYNQHVFDSSCYPVDRWLEDCATQLSGVLVVSLQVNKFRQLPYMVDGITPLAKGVLSWHGL